MVDPKRCPFCKEENRCEANTTNQCWCNDVSFPADLLELILTDLKRTACVCQKCVELYIKDPKTFKATYC